MNRGKVGDEHCGSRGGSTPLLSSIYSGPVPCLAEAGTELQPDTDAKDGPVRKELWCEAAVMNVMAGVGPVAHGKCVQQSGWNRRCRISEGATGNASESPSHLLSSWAWPYNQLPYPAGSSFLLCSNCTAPSTPQAFSLVCYHSFLSSLLPTLAPAIRPIYCSPLNLPKALF